MHNNSKWQAGATYLWRIGQSFCKKNNSEIRDWVLIDKLKEFNSNSI
jgi:hypothetical protein